MNSSRFVSFFFFIFRVNFSVYVCGLGGGDAGVHLYICYPLWNKVLKSSFPFMLEALVVT